MARCFDRSTERAEFFNCKENVVCFVNAHNNGMTSFLKTILQSMQFIFIIENINHDIVFDIGDNDTNKCELSRRNFLDLEEQRLKDAKFFMNLFYLLPDVGTFFQSLGTNIVEEKISELNNERYSFESFLSYYLTVNKSNYPIYIITEHADRCTCLFLSKVKHLLDIGNFKLIFTMDGPVIREEFNGIFQHYKEIDFSKPSYNDALIIFDNLKMDKSFYDCEMYNSSTSIFDFIQRYRNKRSIEDKYDDPIDEVLIPYLNQIPCLYGQPDLKILFEYLECNAYVNKKIDAEPYLTYLCNEGIISEKGHLLCTTNSYSKSINVDIQFKGFILYALNYYINLTYDFLFYIVNVCNSEHLPVSTDIYEYLTLCSSSKSEISNLLTYYLSTNYNYSSYLKMCKIIFKKKLYDLLFDYNKEIVANLSAFNYLLKLIIKDKQHLFVNKLNYNKAICHCMELYNNIDIKCMFAILYLDFCINHDKKSMGKFLCDSGIFYFINFYNSKYYYILESIIAYYISDEILAVGLYTDAINKSKSKEKIYLLCNQFAYYLSRFINRGAYSSECEKTYNEILLEGNHWVLNNDFLNTNLLLYQSILSKQNKFNLAKFKDASKGLYYLGLKTWDLYKIINAKILDFVLSDEYDILQYTELERLITDTNRAPAKNIYYYNLFIVAKCKGNKKLLKQAERFLNNNADFKFSNIFDIYNKVKIYPVDFIIENKASLVRYGYIFSRFTEVGYLFDEIAVFNK